jgi:hypothetical protein
MTSEEIRNMHMDNVSDDGFEIGLRRQEIAYQLALLNETILPILQEEAAQTKKWRADQAAFMNRDRK